MYNPLIWQHGSLDMLSLLLRSSNCNQANLRWRDVTMAAAHAAHVAALLQDIGHAWAQGAETTRHHTLPHFIRKDLSYSGRGSHSHLGWWVILWTRTKLRDWWQWKNLAKRMAYVVCWTGINSINWKYRTHSYRHWDVKLQECMCSHSLSPRCWSPDMWRL